MTVQKKVCSIAVVKCLKNTCQEAEELFCRTINLMLRNNLRYYYCKGLAKVHSYILKSKTEKYAT